MACPVCLHTFGDPRLLPCLHSVCRSCIDQLFVTAGSEQEIRCPVCRASCCLPECGAAALPRDAMNTSEQNKCVACLQENDSKNSQVAVRCNSCDVLLCHDHIAPHIRSYPNAHHALDTIETPSMEEPTDELPSSLNNRQQKKCTFKLCPDHGQVLMYYCTQCDVFVCGGCTAIGKHAGHKPVVRATEVAGKTQEKADVQVQKLSSDVKPRLEEALHAVDHVITQLTTNADQVRDNIRSATQQAVHTVQACGEQLLQQVDDIETARHKVLEEQRDSLNTHLNAVNNALQFKTRLLKHQNLEEQIELLEALKCRALSLAETHVETQPCRHANLQFIPPADSVLMAKAKETLGTLMPCQASASHCSFEHLRRDLLKGAEAMFVLQTADSNGHRLTDGADHIVTHWSTTPTGVTDPAVTVKDKKDGTYEVCVKPSMTGQYKLEIKVNGENFPHPIYFRSINQMFDENECCPDISLSANQTKATRRENNEFYASVLGAFGMQDGTHSWQIRVTPSRSNKWAVAGIASKPLPNKSNNYDRSQSFRLDCSRTNATNGADYTSTISAVQSGDMLRFVLDCDEHTLQVTNLRSQQSATITDLPVKKYFLYVNIYGKGGSMELF